MAKLPYGGHDAQPDNLDSWGFLEQIAESLNKGEVIRPQLARWLGEAIKSSNRNSSKLLVALSLKNPRGGLAMNPDNWLKYGERLYELESSGIKTEKAIVIILEESTHKAKGIEPFSRTTLQNWRDKYVAALALHQAISDAEYYANE